MDNKDYELQELLQTLEQCTNWDGTPLVKYNGFWHPLRLLGSVLSIQKYFIAENSDVILVTLSKSGTTWLKAPTFSILNRSVYKPSDQNSPLLTNHPHKLVPFLESSHLENNNPYSPRIFSTHIPLVTLPQSISKCCKIIYLCRNPLDQFVSDRQFLLENKLEKDAVPLEIDEAFDLFYQGMHMCGPIWDHMLGYWDAHSDNPERVLFLKYEDLIQDIGFYVKKIAEFLGCPFSAEEQEQGVVEEIARLCSFENLKNLEVNKMGCFQRPYVIKHSSFFRKGKVGDWANYLTHEMADRVNKITDSRFQGRGLMFNI